MTNDSLILLGGLFVIFQLLQGKLSSMSASTDKLAASVSDLSSAVSGVTAVIADLKSRVSDPADIAAIDKAADDIKAVTEALKAAVS